MLLEGIRGPCVPQLQAGLQTFYTRHNIGTSSLLLSEMSSFRISCFFVLTTLRRYHSAPTASISPSLAAFATDTPILPANRTSPRFVGFVDGPNSRGTASLVLSCLLTLLLCVWSALHLNIPKQGQNPLQSFFVYIRWIIVGVYAPELVVFTAWRQWSSARILNTIVESMEEKRRVFIIGLLRKPDVAKEREPKRRSSAPSEAGGHSCLQSTLQDEPIDHEPYEAERTLSNGNCDSETTTSSKPFAVTGFERNRHEWTMAHNFFASTGGFAFEVEAEGAAEPRQERVGPFLPPGTSRRLTLTARGMALLARCGRLPDIAKADINDKSKANDVAKALVMIQASWMLIQVVGRLIAKMPVTLLEVNTIAHV